MRPTRLFSFSTDNRLSPYSKLLLTSPTQALRMVEEEKAVLQAQLSLEDDTQGCFIQSALCLLKVASMGKIVIPAWGNVVFRFKINGTLTSLYEHTDDLLSGFQEREEMLLKQQKVNSPDVLKMSSLTLEEESSPVEDVLPKTSGSKVGVDLLLLKSFVCSPGQACVLVSACRRVLLCLRWSWGGGFRSCPCRAANPTWRHSGMCVRRASRAYDGPNSRAGDSWGELGPGTIKCCART